VCKIPARQRTAIVMGMAHRRLNTVLTACILFIHAQYTPIYIIHTRTVHTDFDTIKRGEIDRYRHICDSPTQTQIHDHMYSRSLSFSLSLSPPLSHACMHACDKICVSLVSSCRCALLPFTHAYLYADIQVLCSTQDPCARPAR
jgi:hypothetical protein